MHSCLLQAANIVTLYDVSNIWCIPLLLRVCHICFLWSHFPLFWILESIFWAEFLCTLQDQKAHEAILKVLNLDRVERFVSNIQIISSLQAVTLLCAGNLYLFITFPALLGNQSQMSGLKELPYLMPFKTLLAYSPIKILALRNIFILCFM